MNMKKLILCTLACALVLSLAGCGDPGTGVYVQSVKTLSGMGAITAGDRFAGMVVSESVTEIEKDSDKSIAELLVKAGDDVVEGQELFSYDTDELQLTLDKQRLELEQLEAMVENYKEQIEDLEAEREYAWGSDQLQYTVQIQTMQVDLKEAELNIDAKKKEIGQSELILENAVVTAPVSGRVQTINENGTDNYGMPVPYITIQQAGSYRIKGMLGELQVGGIMEGSRIRILSRTNEEDIWYGTVTLVDYENATQGDENAMYYGMTTDSMTTASRYPFYVELDSTEGLMLGQHVYLELDMGETELVGVPLPSAFLCYNDDGTTYVWAENSGKLEKRTVTAGDYDPMTDSFSILEGLREQDYVAFPDPALCTEGASTTHEQPSVEESPEGEVILP